jgi:hypothetical protein
MKKINLGLAVLMFGFLFIGINGFAADGDLIVNGNSTVGGNSTVNGNIGIGTASPGAKLHINYDTTNSLGQVILKSSTSDSATSGTKISWYNAGGSEVAAIQAVNNAGDGIITFNNNIPWTGTLTERMRIDGNGNVGIGTNNPFRKLEIRDSNSIPFRISGETPNNYLDVGNVNTGTYFYTYFRPGSAATDPITFYSPSNGSTTGIRIRNFGGNWNWLDLYNNDSYAVITSSTNISFQPTSGNVGIGTTNPGSYKLYVAGPAYSTGGWQSSDLRFKENIKPIESPLNKILNMEGISFDWKKDEFKDKGFPEGRHYGVVAQEVEKVLPEVVKEGPGGEKSVSYTEIVPVLIEAMKEQQKTIEKQQKEIEELRTEINELRSNIPKNVASLKP